MCINGTPSWEEEYQKVDYVIEGKVVSIKKDIPVSYIYKGETYEDLEDEVSIYVGKSFKRPSNPIIKFRNSQDSAALPVIKGRRYLLFLFRDRPGGELKVDTCGSSGEVDRKRIFIISQLSSMYRPGPTNR